MFKKANTKTLGIIFAALLALVLTVTVVDNKKGGRTFPENLVKVDTADISKILISGNGNKTIELVKTEGIWKMKLDEKYINASASKINNILDMLTRVKPNGLVSEEKERWKDYEVSDSSAIRVEIYDHKKKKSDILFGKFDFKPANNGYSRQNQGIQGTVKNYVRIHGQKKVYAVNEVLSGYSMNGIFRLTLSNDLDSYRDATVAKLNPNDLTKIGFSYPADSSFTLTTVNGKWNIGGSEADSMSVVNYLRSFQNMSNMSFTNKKPLGEARFKVTLEGNNIIEPLVLSAYTLTDSTYLVTSSMNKDACFESDKGGLFNRIFVGTTKFLHK